MIMIIIIIAKIMHALIQAPSRANGASSATIPATASAWRSGRRSRSEAGGGNPRGSEPRWSLVR